MQADRRLSQFCIISAERCQNHALILLGVFSVFGSLILVVFYFDGGFKSFFFYVRLINVFCTGGKASVLSAVCRAEIN